MFGSRDDDYDAYCINCGAGYYFEVGPGGFTCPSCGKSRETKEGEEPEYKPVDISYYRNHFVDELRRCRIRAHELEKLIATIDNGTFDVDNPPFI